MHHAHALLIVRLLTKLLASKLVSFEMAHALSSNFQPVFEVSFAFALIGAQILTILLRPEQTPCTITSTEFEANIHTTGCSS